MSQEVAVVQTVSPAAPPAIPLAKELPITTSTTSVTEFVLDQTLFNQKLYSRILSFWFVGLDETATAASPLAMRRWFRHGASEAQVTQFDVECQQRFGEVIRSVGPDRLSLPEFESYAIDKLQAESIARPFLAEVRRARMQSPGRAVKTLLALVILLDQIPRNMYRTPDGLRRVYGHYDRLAYALLYASLALSPACPVAQEAFRLRAVYRSWMFVPLLHAEDLASQVFLDNLFQQCKSDMIIAGDVAGQRFAENRLSATQRHLKIVDRFGRFPHRNEGLGRKDTAEEERWLEAGGETFGVKQIRICARL